jgi:sugar-specific transcriptional regulator TrmB
MERLIKRIKEVGLSERESELYVALLKRGPSKGGELARSLSMDRTHTYNIINNLINKGLVSSVLEDRKTLFEANSPKNLLNQIKKKEEIIKSVLPDLEALEVKNQKKSNITILEGKAGLRTLLRELFESGVKEIQVFGGTGKSYEFLEYEMGHVEKKTLLLGMHGKIITGSKLAGKLFTRLPNFDIKYIEEMTDTSTMIFGDKVSINVFDDRPFIILIENKSVAQSYKKYFEYLWKIAK